MIDNNQPKVFPKYTPNPLLRGLPQYLKDPKNYKKIQKTTINALAGTHSHGEIMEWAECFVCQKRFAERSGVMKKLGFQSPAQYLEWSKVMRIMINPKRVPIR
jgi:hypothetical protein